MEIVPGERIGNFKIGDTIHNQPLFGKLTKVSDKIFSLDHLTIRIDSAGRIDLVSTSQGNYKGILVGKTFRQVIEEGYDLLYDEFDQVFYLKSPEGLCVGKEYENLHLLVLLNSKIQYLNIFDANADKEFWTKIKDDFQELNRSNVSEIA